MFGFPCIIRDFGKCFHFESWCCFKISNMRGKRTRTLCTRARSTRSTSSTFVTFVQQIDNIIQQAPKMAFFGINLVHLGVRSFWEQPHQGAARGHGTGGGPAHELLDLAKTRKWHEARRWFLTNGPDVWCLSITSHGVLMFLGSALPTNLVSMFLFVNRVIRWTHHGCGTWARVLVLPEELG